MKDVRLLFGMSITAIAALAIVGCGGGDPATPASGAPASSSAAANRPVEVPNAEAGVEVPASADPQMYSMLHQGRNFGGTRRDPFSLRPNEIAFDNSQLSERLQSEGGWPELIEPPKKPEVNDREEPQPYRRLAGVIIGDTVTAIIIMEDGHAEQIRPGMQIPNSEWTVVSIDQDKAILRRSGNRKPNQIIVNLESAPPGTVGNRGGGGGNNNSGGNQGRGGRGGRQGGPGLAPSGG